ncbi:MAG: Asp-tRNA(Asn)/Glu-tRNA(Gln) amidotransferase subunit GatB [Candidatus Sumerlaeota bacterium]|nr:Asp-tRNA(Asn)/Glu-tRNA(Gln) amidotransferase subunit GatB [Candidatus Sumerlaeota bacterium]
MTEHAASIEYEPVIGFEIHAELKTKSKVFCGCKVDFGAPPNTQVCPVCLGMPGSLPVLNRQCVELVLRTALAANCHINEHASFDRKNYYYPDLPKNYQISEQYSIIGVKGYVDYPFNGAMQRVRINNIHLEEDAGKNIHAEVGREEYSLVDLNRAGTGLMEVVTEPDIRSLEEANAFMKHIKNLLEYIEVSDCKMQEGSLRFELNVSVRPKGSDKLSSAYVEVKNVASMKTVLAAADYEIKRQTKLHREGSAIAKETRLWDDLENCTRTMRSKETAKDYRYFPEPDLVELNITPDWQERVRREIPELQPDKQKRFMEQYGLPEYDVALLTQSKAVADYFETVVRTHNNPKSASNWMMTEVMREMNEKFIEPSDLKMPAAHLGQMLAMIDKGQISGKIGKQIFPEMLETGKAPADIVKEKGLIQISDTVEIEKIADEAMAALPEVCAEIRGGKQKAMGRLVGEVMKRSKGQANPGMVNEILAGRFST